MKIKNRTSNLPLMIWYLVLIIVTIMMATIFTVVKL